MQAYSICLFLASPFVGTEKQGCARNAIPLRLKNKKPNRIRVEHPHKNFSTSSSPLCSLRLTFPRSSQRQLLAEGQHHGDEPIKVFSIIFAQAFALKRDEGGLFSLFCDYLGKIKPKDRREGLKLYSRGDEILSLKAGDHGGRKTGQLSKLRMGQAFSLSKVCYGVSQRGGGYDVHRRPSLFTIPQLQHIMSGSIRKEAYMWTVQHWPDTPELVSLMMLTHWYTLQGFQYTSTIFRYRNICLFVNLSIRVWIHVN